MENLLWYKEQAQSFEEALPLGNGKLGAMVYGKTDLEKISLNIDTLWSGHPEEHTDSAPYSVYTKMKRTFSEGKRKEAQDIIENGFCGSEANAYLPAGSLYIKIGDETCRNYKRLLKLDCATATCSYNTDTEEIKSECFISAVDDVLVYKITSSKKRDFKLWLDAQLKHTTWYDENVMILSGKAYDGRFQEDSYEREDTVKYTIALLPVTDGEIISDSGKTSVKNATELTLYLSIKTSFVSWNAVPDAEHLLPAINTTKKAFKKGFDDVKKDHINDFSSYYNRVKTDFGNEISSQSTLERIKSEEKDLGLVELLFNFGRYLIVSSSRPGSLATNLQGIWNEKLSPPWGSDYTTNINTQMNYWPVLVCNLPEFAVPLTELIKAVSKSGEITAKTHYGSCGFTAHHNFDIWAKTTPAPGSSCWMYWNLGSGWMCKHLFDYYEYTNDLEFLKNTAVPIMKKAAEFYMNLLEKDGEKMILTPSTSPENAYYCEGEKLHLAKYATMSQAIIMDLFRNLEKACEILGEEKPNLYPQEALNTYAIGNKGQLLEYDDDYNEPEPTHRHVSHLYGLYPGESITTENKELSEACKKSLEIRGDLGTGWAIGWKTNLWAKLKDGNRALKLIKNQLRFVESSNQLGDGKGGSYTNMFDAHPPFQIDGNFGITSGIAQMFLQCENDKIKILPALPDEFKQGSIQGLLAKGSIITNIWWESGKLKRVQFISHTDQNIKVEIQNDNLYDISLKKDKVFEI